MSTRLGKTIAHRTYLHASALDQLDAPTRERIQSAEQIAEVSVGVQCNVVKLDANGHIISLLSYPGFFEEAFPSLCASWTVDLDQRSVRYRTYANSLNPPILHRKELLLSDSHPDYREFEALTAAAEQTGLFDDPVRIGFRQAWEDLLQQRGYRISGHQLVPIANDESEAVALTEKAPPFSQREGWHEFPNTVARHLTALQRHGLSAPVQTLARFGFLDGTKRVFDYGCGRGDDLRGLRENGIEANGWDPHFAPHELKRSAALVNLGFVINVIESIEERIEAVQAAYALTEELLVVSAMLANQEAVRGQPYGDGILTSRNTFQKYYSQGELGQFVAEVLDEEPLPVAPGIYYVFKDKDAEQRFRMSRQQNRRNILRLSRLSRPQKPIRIDRAQAKYQQNQELLESLWERSLTLGREPEREEIANLDEIVAAFGSPRAALRFIKSRKDSAQDVLEAAHRSRIDDLRVYFAQLQFERRKPYRHLESRLQRDVRAFFGDYREAMAQGRGLLFAAGQVDAIAQACEQAAQNGIGWLEEEKSLQLHSSLVSQLPPILRTYVNCGLQLYGDASSADLIKIHIHSGKLTLMSFDDFVGKPIPRMLHRIKVRLRDLDFDLFEYGDDYLPPYLYRKSRFINEELPNYAEQLAFDESLERLGLFDLDGYGPTSTEFDDTLAAARWEIEDFRLARSQSIPDLDAPCGRYFRYRDLIECGETQARTRLANLPKEPDSYTALHDLAFNILDPVIDYFGMIRLTYGFCSPELTRYITARTAPKLDQHAAHELTNLGSPICKRLGAAADFLVENENMEEVANWVAANLDYDRIYFYRRDQPIHISYGPENTRAFVQFLESRGKRIPSIRRLTSQRLVATKHKFC